MITTETPNTRLRLKYAWKIAFEAEALGTPAPKSNCKFCQSLEQAARWELLRWRLWEIRKARLMRRMSRGEQLRAKVLSYWCTTGCYEPGQEHTWGLFIQLNLAVLLLCFYGGLNLMLSVNYYPFYQTSFLLLLVKCLLAVLHIIVFNQGLLWILLANMCITGLPAQFGRGASLLLTS